MVGDAIKQPGENWTSSDGCTFFACERFGDQLSVTTQQESCPSLEDCPEDKVYVKGCCKHCNVTIENQVRCAPEAMPERKTVGIVKQHGLHGVCTNKGPIEGFMECLGNCESMTTFNTGEFNFCVPVSENVGKC